MKPRILSSILSSCYLFIARINYQCMRFLRFKNLFEIIKHYFLHEIFIALELLSKKRFVLRLSNFGKKLTVVNVHCIDAGKHSVMLMTMDCWNCGVSKSINALNHRYRSEAIFFKLQSVRQAASFG